MRLFMLIIVVASTGSIYADAGKYISCLLDNRLVVTLEGLPAV